MDAKRAAYDETMAPAADADGCSLPGWIYRDADFLEAEKERVFAPSWQIVCHVSDIPNPGDYHTLDFLGEPLVAVRGRDRAVNTFSTSAGIEHRGCSTAVPDTARDASCVRITRGPMDSTGAWPRYHTAGNLPIFRPSSTA